MLLRLILPLTLAAGVAAAPLQQSTAGRAAERFRLDMPGSDASAAPTPEPTAASTLPPPALPDSAAVTSSAPQASTADAPAAPESASSDAPQPSGARAAYTLDTPIRDLIANPTTKAVLDKDLPGLSDDENLAKFDKLGLKQFQPLTGGQLTDAMLAKVAKDLAATGGASLAAPVKTPGSRRRRDDSR